MNAQRLCVVCKQPFFARQARHIYCTDPNCQRVKYREAHKRSDAKAKAKKQ